MGGWPGKIRGAVPFDCGTVVLVHDSLPGLRWIQSCLTMRILSLTRRGSLGLNGEQVSLAAVFVP